jgi:hypothetical protein
MIELGTRVKDSISGFMGIATARTTWLYKMPQICIEPQDLYNEAPISAQWFDEPRVVLVMPEVPTVPHFGAVSLDSDFYHELKLAEKGDRK